MTSHSPGHHRPGWYASNAGQGTPGTQPTNLAEGDRVSEILIGKYEATIYPEGYGFTGAISLGFDGKGNRQRIKREGRTKAIVKDKLIKAVADRDAGLKTVEGYTVAQAVQDWLSKGLKGRDDETITANRILAEQHVLPLIGATKLTELNADDVDDWLDGLTTKLATRSLQGVHAILKRAIRQAQARDRVMRNVAELVTTPKGKPGRPSKAMTLEQATAMLEESKASRLHAYIVVSLLTGIRTEEARALRWSHVVAWSATRPGGSRSPKPGLITSGSRSTSGARCGPAATPRPRSPAGLWSSPARPPMRSASTAHSKRRTGWPQDLCGTIMASSSPARQAHPWTRPTSAGRSSRSPGRPGSAELDAARAASLVRVDHERQRRSHRDHR